MPRFDDDRLDDEDDVLGERPRKSQGGFPVWAIVLACALPIGVVVLVVGGLALFWARGDSTNAQRAEAHVEFVAAREASKTGMKIVYTRDVFKALVMNKTTDEVIVAVGRPDSTVDLGNRPLWIFNNRTTDPITGNLDPTATVTIEGGRVVSVVY
jgi:hypothetical protein